MNRANLKKALRSVVMEALSDYLRDSEEDLRSLQAAHPSIDVPMAKSPVDMEDDEEEMQSVDEASTTVAVSGYQTPYAFSDAPLHRDAKKHKIANQLGYTIVKKQRRT